MLLARHLQRPVICVDTSEAFLGAVEVRDHWEVEYPEMASEEVDIARAEGQGFRLLFTERLPAGAWWRNYDGPLAQRLDAHSDHFGYTFYVLRTA